MDDTCKFGFAKLVTGRKDFSIKQKVSSIDDTCRFGKYKFKGNSFKQASPEPTAHRTDLFHHFQNKFHNPYRLSVHSLSEEQIP